MPTKDVRANVMEGVGETFRQLQRFNADQRASSPSRWTTSR